MKSPRYVWYVIGLLTIVNVFNYMDRMALAVLLPRIKEDLVLSDGQLGLLIGLAFSLFYAVAGLPLARWADRGVRRDIIALALATWSVMTAVSGAAQNFWHLFAARIGVGAGEAGCLPPAQSILCDYVPLKRRSGVFALHSFGLIAGMMIGMALAGWLGDIIGWRWTFVVLGLPGIALAVIVRLTLREPVRGALDAATDDKTVLPIGRTLGVLWRCKTYRLLALFYALNGFILNGLNQWWPSYYTRVLGFGLSSVGVYLGIAIAVGSGAGLLAGGLLANKAAQRDVTMPLLIGVGATVLAIPTVLGTLLVTSQSASMLLVALTCFCWCVSNGPVIATVNSIVTSRMRATAGAITALFSTGLGLTLGPLCVGVLSDVLTPSLGVQGLRYALLFPIAFLPVLAFVLYAATRAMPNDLRAAGAQI